jgi:ribonucleotide reductase alpha subunit
MQVRKRNGDTEPIDAGKVVHAVRRCAGGLDQVDPARVAAKTISGLYDGATTAELDRLSIQTAAELTAEEPQYSRLAARLLAAYIGKEAGNQGIASFSQSVSLGHAEGLIGDETAKFVKDHARTLNDAIDPASDSRFEYFGIKTVYDRYLLRHPATRQVIETPQHWLMRVACGLSATPDEAIDFYRLMSSLAYLPSSPTLFNSGTSHPQMSSCFLVDSPRDDLESIYARYAQVASLSKFSGGIGIGWSRIRGRGALIRGTNGQSNGIVPFLRTLDASVAAVNQGGRRKGAACVYLEPWHPDIEEFLELRDNTGEEARRTHNLNLANWIPDEFMRRVEADGMWSLIDPSAVPELPDLWGVAVTARERWKALRSRITATGLRNSLLIAIAPTATIASIVGCYECIEPQVSNLFKRETMSGEFLQVNTALVAELKELGRWNQATRDAIKRAEGSVQHIEELPQETRLLFRTAWELPQRALIDMAAARAPFVDQSQSLNLFVAAPSIGKLSSMYLYAWKSGLKTTYYLRSRPATRIQQATVTEPPPDADAIACSLENPEACEACQ